MAIHARTDVFFVPLGLPLHELSGDELRREASKRLTATADAAADDCRELTQRVDEMLTSGKWRELSATWDSFCYEYFKKPSAFIDAIVNGVRILDMVDVNLASQWLTEKKKQLCVTCGKTLAGKKGNKFCSPACKQKSYRLKKQ
ncbi:MAG: hypothetical protein WCR46_14915 [Deltaproteobacteria bacterium]